MSGADRRLPDRSAVRVRPRTERLVEILLRTRRHRDLAIGRALFSDPAWDMLLELYAGDLKGRPLCFGDLVLAGSVPATTARRCIQRLEAAGMLIRSADPCDGRRSICRRSPAVAQAMDDVFDRLARQLEAWVREGEGVVGGRADGGGGRGAALAGVPA